MLASLIDRIGCQTGSCCFAVDFEEDESCLRMIASFERVETEVASYLGLSASSVCNGTANIACSLCPFQNSILSV